MPIAAGRARLLLRNDALNIARVIELAVPHGGLVREHVALGTGQVAFKIDPWAHIFLKGRRIATTPVAPLTLYEGAYEFLLVNPDNDVSATVRVQVARGETTKVARSLR